MLLLEEDNVVDTSKDFIGGYEDFLANKMSKEKIRDRVSQLRRTIKVIEKVLSDIDSGKITASDAQKAELDAQKTVLTDLLDNNTYTPDEEKNNDAGKNDNADGKKDKVNGEGDEKGDQQNSEKNGKDANSEQDGSNQDQSQENGKNKSSNSNAGDNQENEEETVSEEETDGDSSNINNTTSNKQQKSSKSKSKNGQQGNDSEDAQDGQNGQSQNSDEQSNEQNGNQQGNQGQNGQNQNQGQQQNDQNNQDQQNNDQGDNDEEQDIKKQLDTLLSKSKDAVKKGILNAIKVNLLANQKIKQENLTEDIKSNSTIEELDDNTFEAIINRALDAIDAVSENGSYVAKSDPSTVKKIADSAVRDFNDIDFENRIKDAEKAQKLAKARKQENKRYKNFDSFDDAIIDISKAVHGQVKLYKQALTTYAMPNRRYSGTDILAPGKLKVMQKDLKKPSVALFIDQSSSWGNREKIEAKKLVASIQKLADRKDIDLDIYYFADRVSNNEYEKIGTSTHAWNAIIQRVLAGPNGDYSTPYMNVILVTDEDMGYQGAQAQDAKRALVDGYVWIVWRDESSGRDNECDPIRTKLIGKKSDYGAYEYTLK